MKKYLTLILAFCVIAALTALCMTACDLTDTTDTTAEETPAPTDAPTEEPAGTEEPTEAPTEAPTEEETTVEETTEEVTTEAVTETPWGGEDHGVVRDGTPKKYITIRMDDGITQDARMMEIMRKYGVDCCTFYVNTGLYGANWAWVGQQFNRPDVTHIRYTRAELESGIYDGFDVECHTRTHPSLKNLSERQVTREVKTDAENIEKIFGYKPIGMAWPGGDTEWNEGNVMTEYETAFSSQGIKINMLEVTKPDGFMPEIPDFRHRHNGG